MVSVPIIDYENPFYCPSPLQFHSIRLADSNDDLSISPFSQKGASAAQALAHNHKGVKTRNYGQPGTSISSIHALVYRVVDDLFEEHVVGHKLASISYDSSPCARFLSSLDERGPVRKRARYTRPTNESKLNSFAIPDGEWNEHCGIKQEYLSPALPDRTEEERVYEASEEQYEKTPGKLIDPCGIVLARPLFAADSQVLASIPDCHVEDRVTTRTLLLRLDQVFPRMGFREAVNSAEHLWPETDAQYRYERHQALVDLLGERGVLNEYALTALHDAEFRHLDLGPTMSGINELDLPQGDVMRVFSQPGWFKHLRSLSLAGGRLRDDFDLAYIQPFRRIEKLVLANTGIGNEGVFLILALKHNLRHLNLSGNPSINDDSMPALILLDDLQYLSVFGTGVLMPGLRKLAVAMKAGKRVMDIKIPNVCKDYIDRMHWQYLLHPAPPLISDPGIVGMLSKTALSRNLEAHAIINSTIVSTGPHDEMEERLLRILETRKLDLVVREMLVDREAQGSRV